jgi:DNA-binding GntR family transcriptional regulator
VYDRRGPVPVYKLVAQQIRRRIDNGELRPGHAIPSEAEIVAEHQVARITARLAIKHLRDEGLIYTIQGKGSFVGPENVPRVSRRRLVHQQIAESLIEQIQAGKLRPDLPIPSEVTLMQQYGVAKGTARQAVKLLRELGWVYTVPQRGTYVMQSQDWPKS